MTKEDIYQALTDISEDIEKRLDIRARQKIASLKEDLVKTPSAFISQPALATSHSENSRNEEIRNLEDAAEKNLPETYMYADTFTEDGPKSEPVYSCEQMLTMYKAGAEWMAGQGISVEGNTDTGLPENNYMQLQDYLDSLPKETELILQIRKK